MDREWEYFTPLLIFPLISFIVYLSQRGKGYNIYSHFVYIYITKLDLIYKHSIAFTSAYLPTFNSS